MIGSGTQRYHHQSSVVGDILCPSNGIRDDLKRRGITPHDHMKDNYRHIQEIQQQKREEMAEKEYVKTQPIFKMQKFENVESRAMKIAKESYEGQENRHSDFLRAKTGFVSTSGKTIEQDEYDIEAANLPRKPSLPPEAYGGAAHNNSNNGTNVKNYIIQNKAAAIHKPSQPLPKTEVEKRKRQEIMTKTTHKAGEVPVYIQKRQQEMAAEKERIKQEKEKKALLAKVPPNTRLVSDEERRELLNGFKESLKIEIRRLNSFPVCGDTVGIVKSKNDCERKIEQLEKTIAEFERPGDLYIALD